MRVYYVYGDYGYTSEQELYDTPNLQEALDFARNYTRWGDMGGYNCIEVAWFADDGEYMEELRILADDEDGFDADIYGEEPEWEYFSD
jgi:cytosine/adenosine deaminase-related metal-dependent hydrolase